MCRFWLALLLFFNAASAEAQVAQSAEEIFNSDIFVDLGKRYEETEKEQNRPCIFQRDAGAQIFDAHDYRNSITARFFTESPPQTHILDIDRPFQRLVVNSGDKIYIRLLERAGSRWNYDINGESLIPIGSHKLGNILTLALQAVRPGAVLIYFDRLNGREVTAVRKAKIIVDN